MERSGVGKGCRGHTLWIFRPAKASCMDDPGTPPPPTHPRTKSRRLAAGARVALRGDQGRDLAIVLGLTGTTFALAAAFDLTEIYTTWAVGVERDTGLSIDELPTTLGIGAFGAAWFAWRRWREARQQAK